MQTIDIGSLIKTARSISPDRKYSLAWSSSGVIGVQELKDNSRVLVFREIHGAILKAGFSADMRHIVAENEDGSFSIWFTKDEIDGIECVAPDNIVLFMSENVSVPCININPNAAERNGYRCHFSLRDFSDAIYDWFGWPDYYCKFCVWFKVPLKNSVIKRMECLVDNGCGCDYRPKP